MRKIMLLWILCGGIFLESCKDNAPTCSKTVAETKLTGIDQDQLTKDIGKIDAYLLSKGLVAQMEPHGTRYIINNLGSGITPCVESKINVTYKGTLLGSTTAFDSNTNITFTLSNLILGWQLVLPVIPVGSKVTLFIPSGYGYGSSVSAGGAIPANSNLIFDIEILAVK